MDLSKLFSDVQDLRAVEITGGDNDCAPPIKVEIKRVAETPAKREKIAKAPKAPKVEKSTVAAAEPVEVVQNAETALLFHDAIKAAGFRQATNDDGEPAFYPAPNDHKPRMLPRDAKLEENDKIAALVKFTGRYQEGKGAPTLAMQLDQASHRATVLINPSLGGEGRKPRTAPTVAGFVAGSAAANADDRFLNRLKGDQRSLMDVYAKAAKDGDKAKASATWAKIEALNAQIRAYR
jgi:hypothetical protein